jgi:hypothetical protein
MDYRIFRLCDHARVDTLEAYVLARAYDATWRSLYLCEPVGQHTIEGLGLAIDFGASGSRRN